MKHPCVELYFDVETTDCNIRVWMKTNGILENGDVDPIFYKHAQDLREQLTRLVHHSMAELTQFLEERVTLSAFQISMREDYRNLSLVVYREWP